MSNEKQEEFSGSREFTYIEPRLGRRRTEYEELTLYVQQDPKNFAWAGWPLLFPDGTRATWTERSTALRCNDWWAYRDPNKIWQRVYVKLQAEQGKGLERVIETAKNRGLFGDLDATWAQEILARHYAACAFLEYGLFRCFSYMQREALSDAIGNVFVFNAADKIRYAQEISLYGMELAQAWPGLSDAEAKHTWLTDPMWQGTRENVEKLMVLRDWGEMVAAVNLVFEPLVNELIRFEFFARFAPRNGDSVTPVIVESAELDWERNQKWTKAFVQLLLSDPAHGEHNRRVFQEWVGKWTPLARKAVQGLAPLFELPSVKPQTFAEAWSRVEQTHTMLLAELGLLAVKEV